MNSSKNTITLWMIACMGLAGVSPVLRDILQQIRFASLSEREISQEVVLESADFFEKLGPRDYAQAPEFIRVDMAPVYESLDLISDIAIALAGDTLRADGAVLMAKLDSLERRVRDLEQFLRQRADAQQNPNFGELLGFVRNEVELLAHAVEATRYKAGQRRDVARDLFDLRNRAVVVFNIASEVLLRVFNKVKENAEVAQLHGFLVRKLREIQLDGLFDPEVPYFSLPPEFAENKERRILSYLELYPQDPAAILALVQLYIEMRNINDAYVLYMQFLNNRQLTSDLEEIKYVIRTMLQRYMQETRQARLATAQVRLHENLSAEIQESYDVVGATGDDRILAILPYPASSIAIQQITDETGRPLPSYNLRPIWKNSSAMLISGAGEIEELTLKYRTSDFIKPDVDQGTYAFRYGGVTTSGSFTVEALVPRSFKLTGLETNPPEKSYEDGMLRMKWLNPQLPYRFSALGFVSSKAGIAGEMVSYNLLSQRFLVAIAALVGFLLLSGVLREEWVGSLVGNAMYLLLACSLIIVVQHDLYFVERLARLFNRLDPLVISRLMAILWIVFFLNSRRRYEGSRFVRIVKCGFEVAAVALVARLYLEYMPLEGRLQFTIFLACAIYFFSVLMDHLSTELKISKTLSIGLFLGALLVMQVVSVQVGLFQLSEQALNRFGLLIGLTLIASLGVLYVAHTKVIVNAPDLRYHERLLDTLALWLQPIAASGSRVIILCLVVVALFFEGALSGFVVGLVGAWAEPYLNKLVNMRPKPVPVTVRPRRRRIGRVQQDATPASPPNSA